MTNFESKNLIGFPMSGDRIWILHTPNFDAFITEYNWEITGVDKKLHDLDPDLFHYGSNAYYITGQYISEKGWTVEENKCRYR